ncbi:hypothetical protein ACVXHB_13330 [Escherichia coli]
MHAAGRWWKGNETCVINELARQCGHHFDAEGIKVIEFAQSGLKPLVKFAAEWGLNGMYWSMAMKQGRNMPLRYAAC